MPEFRFNGLPLASWATWDGLVQIVALAIVVAVSVWTFFVRRRAVLLAIQIRQSDEKWKGDCRFKIPWVSIVDPATHLLSGPTDDLPEELKLAVLKWRSARNWSFLVSLILVAVMIWRSESGLL